ncbi:MAG: ATP-binding cassette domain-containing protein [Deltaproteobacteria bacterium]|nr:ATP-binding cassette domain-containing protein [Deltaproteobacteria bacterium]
MIETFNLSKRYRELEAVAGVSFKIADKQVVGLLGPNGAGKTTTMRMLTTYLPPSGGTAKVCGYDINKQAQEVRKQIGYLPETPPIYPELTVEEYLSFVAGIKGISGKKIKEAVDDMLTRCALTQSAKRLCGELSKGYRQRVGLAQALIHNPKVIILDEPTSGLDPAQIIEIRQLIKSLGRDHTVILSTHILQEVAEVCSRVLIIARGCIVVEGDFAELTKEKTLEQRFLEAVASEKYVGNVVNG